MIREFLDQNIGNIINNLSAIMMRHKFHDEEVINSTSPGLYHIVSW